MARRLRFDGDYAREIPGVGIVEPGAELTEDLAARLPAPLVTVIEEDGTEHPLGQQTEMIETAEALVVEVPAEATSRRRARREG